MKIPKESNLLTTKEKERLDENVSRIEDTNNRRNSVLKTYIEKRNNLRAKTNSESQQLLRDNLQNKIEQRDNLDSLKTKKQKKNFVLIMKK